MIREIKKIQIIEPIKMCFMRTYACMYGQKYFRRFMFEKSGTKTQTFNSWEGLKYKQGAPKNIAFDHFLKYICQKTSQQL